MVKGCEKLIDLLFPPRCTNCEELLDFTTLTETSALCKSCLAKWELEKQESCGFCMKAVSECTCMPEALEKVGCSGLYKLAYYRHGTREFVQNKLIFQIKNTRDRHTARFLATELAHILPIGEEDFSSDQTVIVYIPRRKATYLETGTDQGRALAKALSKAVGIPMLSILIRKKGKQKEQKTLSNKERMKNARASYDVRQGVSLVGKTVLLVDDIVTTGASMAACVQKIKRIGAERIYGIAVATDDANQTPMGALPSKHDIFAKGR